MDEKNDVPTTTLVKPNLKEVQEVKETANLLASTSLPKRPPPVSTGLELGAHDGKPKIIQRPNQRSTSSPGKLVTPTEETGSDSSDTQSLPDQSTSLVRTHVWAKAQLSIDIPPPFVDQDKPPLSMHDANKRFYSPGWQVQMPMSAGPSLPPHHPIGDNWAPQHPPPPPQLLGPGAPPIHRGGFDDPNHPANFNMPHFPDTHIPPPPGYHHGPMPAPMGHPNHGHREHSGTFSSLGNQGRRGVSSTTNSNVAFRGKGPEAFTPGRSRGQPRRYSYQQHPHGPNVGMENPQMRDNMNMHAGGRQLSRGSSGNVPMHHGCANMEGIGEYRHCECPRCEIRNRSVRAIAFGDGAWPFDDPTHFQAVLKFNFARFGSVEAVLPTEAKHICVVR